MRLDDVACARRGSDRRAEEDVIREDDVRGQVIAQFLRTVTYYTLLFVAPTDRWINTMSLGQFAKAGVWPLISGAAIVAVAVVAQAMVRARSLGERWDGSGNDNSAAVPAPCRSARRCRSGTDRPA